MRFRGNAPPPLPPIQGKPFLTGSRELSIWAPCRNVAFPLQVRGAVSTLLQSKVSHSHKPQGTHHLPSLSGPQADPVNSSEQENHSWPSEDGETPRTKPQNALRSCCWCGQAPCPEHGGETLLPTHPPLLTLSPQPHQRASDSS